MTDKYKVRDWVKEKIGEEYLKPLFKVCDSFDEINFDSLPDSFVIKCNHGCKWQFIIKDKKSYLENKNLFDYTKKQITNWMRMSFFGFSNFETQYKNIIPKILVEPLLRETLETFPKEIEVLCFNGQPKIIETHKGLDTPKVSVFDENLKSIDLKYTEATEIFDEPADENIKNAVELSKILAQDFKLVRVDWLVYNNRLYFNEMTFTPRAGFILFPKSSEHWNKELGDMLNLKGN